MLFKKRRRLIAQDGNITVEKEGNTIIVTEDGKERRVEIPRKKIKMASCRHRGYHTPLKGFSGVAITGMSASGSAEICDFLSQLGDGLPVCCYPGKSEKNCPLLKYNE